MKDFAKICALLLGTASMPAMTSQEPSSGGTVGSLLLRVQEESAAPFVRHCAEKVPSLKRPLQGEYARFKKRFKKVAASLRTEIIASTDLSKPASPELVRQFEVMGAQDFVRAAALDPLVFCSSLRENLSGATPESIRKNMESAFAQYKASVRQGE
jgi:hypothetical protein